MKNAKLIAIAVLAIVLVAIMFQNRSVEEVHLLFFTVKAPLIVLLLLTSVGGFAIGILTVYLTRHDKDGKLK